MFRNLIDKEKAKAPENIKYNSDADAEYHTSQKYQQDFDTLSPKPETYEDWLAYFKYPDPKKTPQSAGPADLPRDWSYAKSINPFNKRGGAAHYKKSRFLKRKSRKYKSIKKSKKRSFRSRGRH